MAHTIEHAASARAKCRACGERIAKAELRLGERLPNPFAEGEMTHWYHPVCAALKRPEPYLEAAATTEHALERREWMDEQAALGVAHRRLPRVDGAQRAPTGRARCRSCRELIEKDAWRIALVFYEEGRFQPSGFVHAGCCGEYFGTCRVIERARHFCPGLEESDVEELKRAIEVRS
ncbi:MAG: hypothetical protein GY716_14490 [bacterium]|nr:hypothetical protein [bacterium]